jgi:hypothetical protein
MQEQNTPAQTRWASVLLPYVRLVFDFSVGATPSGSPCLVLVQDNDIHCSYDPVCWPVNDEEYKMLEKNLEELKKKKWELERSIEESKGKKRKELEEEVSKIDAEINRVRARIIEIERKATENAWYRIHDKIYEKFMLPYLRLLNISNEEEQKIREAWRATVLLAGHTHSSIPIPIPQGFLVLHSAGSHFIMELYTTYSYELLSKYYREIEDYFVENPYFRDCVKISGSPVPIDESIQQVLQSLLFFTTPQRRGL